ncbi:MAG: serine hydrolase [Chitinophagaceae bacterium]
MRRFYLLILLLSAGVAIMAQSPRTLSGTVTDMAGQPLPSASVRIAGTGTGTITNRTGRFSLYIPDARYQDTLLISFLGYFGKQVAVKDIPASGLTVQLQQRVQDLQEVIVQPLNPLDLLREAIAAIPRNYYSKPFISHGFYRIATQKGDEHIMLSEAVFDIRSYGYSSGKNNEFRLLKMRSVQDEQASHGIDLGIKPKGLYEYDLISDISNAGLLNKSGLRDHQFRLRGIVELNGRQAYHISFDQREGVRESLYKGDLYLDVNSLAFITLRYARSPRGIRYAKYGSAAERALLRLIAMDIDVNKDDLDITYQPYGDQWVLASVRNDNILNFRSNRRYYDFPASIRVDYIVTGVDTLSVPSFSARETLGSNKIIEQQESAFVKDFWKDYNIILADYNSDTIAAAIQARNENFSLKNKLKTQLKKLPGDPAARADSILSYYYRQGAFNGTVLIRHQGQVILRKGYGLADREKGLPATDTTQYRIGSLTKTFTSLLVQQLAAEGRLQLSDSIGRYLTGYVHGQVTIEQLLTHTSGIPNYTNDPAALATVFTGTDPVAVLLARFGSAPLEFVPGNQFRYSNTGYLALAALIEKTTGLSYGEALQQRIFTPLQMKNTGFGNIPINSRGYWLNAPEPVYNPAQTAGAGGIASTVNDLLRWDEALYTPQLLPPDRLQQSFTPRAAYNDWDAWYGYGWMIDRKLFEASRHHSVIYHPGTDFGYYTMFVRQPDTRSLIILLSNAGDFPRFDLTDLLLNAINEK